jgi:hypothetical protein
VLATNALDADAQLDHLPRVDDTTAIKDPTGLGHALRDTDPVDTLLGLVLLRASHTGGEARLLTLALLDAVGAVILAARLAVETVERILRLGTGAVDKVLVKGKKLVGARGRVLEGAGVGLGVGLAANGLGLDGRRRSGRGRRLVAELVEFSSDNDGGTGVTGVVGIAVDGDVVALGEGTEELLDLGLDNQRVTARVEDSDLTRALLKKGLDHLKSGGLTGIRGVLLEGKAKDGNLLANKSVVEALDDTVGETVTGVLVHLNNLSPVLGNLGETHGLGKVDKVKNILLEATATETDTSHQELVTNTRVNTNGAGNLVNISTSLLANGGDGVDGRDTLSQHRVGNELGKLRRPNVGGQNALARDPGVVDLDESLGSSLAGGGRSGTDKDTVRVEKIVDGGTGSQELGVGENLEVNTRAVHGESISDKLGSSARNSGLLNNDGTLTSVLSNDASNGLESGHISGTAGTDTTVLGGGVDGNENDIGLADVLGNVGREEQVGLALVNSDLTLLSGGTLAVGGRTVGDLERSATITGNSDNIMQTGLVDRGVTGVPTADTGDVSIDDSHLDLRVLESNNGRSRTTDITSANTADLADLNGRLLSTV